MTERNISLVPSLFNDSFFPFVLRNLDLLQGDQDNDSSAQSSSSISISEDEEHVYVEVAMPGLKAEEIDITLDKRVLWIKGEKKGEEKKRKYYYKATSSFSYRIAVPGNIDEGTQPSAHFENGIMHITFKKVRKEQPRKITITSAAS
ncbi:MAG: putative small heat shock protein [Chlamydiales bacterium]|jgi:HSP20 family protein|nr:putative small heat shock protein [Chlamydiales bacterium]